MPRAIGGVDPASSTPPSQERRWWSDGFRPLLMRVHFFIGVFVAPFLLVAATTGLLYALTPTIERLVYDDVLHVDPTGEPLPVAEQVEAAEAAVPDGVLGEVRPATTPTDVTRVSFDSPSAPPERRLTAFVDPYTAQITDVLPTFGEWLPVRTWFDDLHRHLHLGDPGRLYSELAASWMWVLAVSGLSLWLVRRIRKGRVRRLFFPRRSRSARARSVSRHGALGVWLALGMLFLSATGLTWSQFAGANVSALRSELSWSTPDIGTEYAGRTVGTIAAQDMPAAIERATTVARGAGLEGPIQVVPTSDGTPWTVAQVQRSWPTQQDQLAIDPGTGEILDRIDFADWPAAAKLAQWGIDAHMGILFGIVNQLVLAGFAIGVILMIVWGYRMWWLRRPTRLPPDRGLAGPLGAGESPSRAAVLTLSLLACVVGLAAPMLGGSLLLFLSGDAVYRTVRTHRNNTLNREEPDTPR